MRRSLFLGLVVLSLTASAAVVAQTTAVAGPIIPPSICFVNAVTGNDLNPCDTPGTAKRTLQAGVNAVASGGTVVVAAGRYTDSVVITRAMRVKGAQSGASRVFALGGHCFDGTDTVVQPLGGITHLGAADAFTVTSSDVVIDGFCITGALAGLYTPAVVPLNVRLLSTVVEESEMGFDIGNCGGCVISRDVFKNLGSLTRPSDPRNRVGRSSALELSDSYFWFLSLYTALVLDGDVTSPDFDHTGATILRNSFFEVDSAMELTHVTQVKILQNDVYAHNTGILLRSATHVYIRNNLLDAQVLAAPGHGVAISIGGSGGPAMLITIRDNSIKGRLYGVSVGPTYTGRLNLRKNWWGSSTGPSPVAINPISDGTGASIQDVGPAGRLSFSPWYCTDASSTPAGSTGFNPTGPLCP